MGRKDTSANESAKPEIITRKARVMDVRIYGGGFKDVRYSCILIVRYKDDYKRDWLKSDNLVNVMKGDTVEIVYEYYNGTHEKFYKSITVIEEVKE